MTITKKVTLKPAPFVGTRIRIVLDDPESLTWGIFCLEIANGREKCIIDWGDGITEEIIADTDNLTHTYAKPGVYEVRLSDDLCGVAFSTKLTTSEYRLVYAPMIRELDTTAKRLTDLDRDCLYNAQNLHRFSCIGSELECLGLRAFGFCPSINGQLFLPKITQLESNTFISSPTITELHFAEANEERIKALPGYGETAPFGAENAVCKFDL